MSTLFPCSGHCAGHELLSSHHRSPGLCLPRQPSDASASLPGRLQHKQVPHEAQEGTQAGPWPCYTCLSWCILGFVCLSHDCMTFMWWLTVMDSHTELSLPSLSSPLCPTAPDLLLCPHTLALSGPAPQVSPPLLSAWTPPKLEGILYRGWQGCGDPSQWLTMSCCLSSSFLPVPSSCQQGPSQALSGHGNPWQVVITEAREIPEMCFLSHFQSSFIISLLHPRSSQV